MRTATLELTGRRVLLRPLAAVDFEQWREVRRRCHDWLTRWEPRPLPGHPDASEDRRAFAAQCGARERERQLGTGYGFGIFVDGRFAGAINLSSIQRGPFQNAYVGYWIDEGLAGHGYMPESVVVILRFAFEELSLHRVQIAIIRGEDVERQVLDLAAAFGAANCGAEPGLRKRVGEPRSHHVGRVHPAVVPVIH